MALVAAKPFLARFDPSHAADIASWIHDERQLHWVSPATQPPLTPDKVLKWPRPDGEAFVLLTEAGSCPAKPLAYSELNHMRCGQGNWWIGHFIVHPQHRGQGLGRLLLDGLLAEAFENLAANSVCLVVFPDNIPASRCYEAAGFRRVGSEYHRFASHEPRLRLVRYEIAREDWLRRQAK